MKCRECFPVSRGRPVRFKNMITQLSKKLLRNIHSKLLSSLKFNKMHTTAKTTFSFIDYDAIGFDLDHCICRYNLPELFKLEYDLLADHIIKQTHHPNEYLKCPYEENKNFILKGLFLDLRRGNILKIANDGQILRATHGTKPMTIEDISKTYMDCHWNLTDKYVQDPLSLWIGDDAMNIQAQTDYFDLPVTLIFARLVDSIDEKNDSRVNNYDVFPDILKGLHAMYDIQNFESQTGGYYSTLQREPTKFIFPNGYGVVKWIQSLRDAGKFVFLLSGSHADYAGLVAEQALGPTWSNLFDLKIFSARKPGFWSLNRSFINNQIKVPGGQLKINETYLEGNFNQLNTFLKKHLNKMNPKIVYVGDSMIQDVYAPNNFCGLDTVAVVEEAEAEGTYGFQKNHFLSSTLSSQIWGSFFTDNDSNTFWKNLITKHANIITPSISSLAEKPIDFRYKTLSCMEDF